MLKEKLQQQQQHGDGEVLDEKAKLRLRDLEEAVKNTWEQKAQLSMQYEHERAQLVAEQQYAFRQLVLAKEKAWNLMVQKDSIEMVISHMRETLVHGSKEETGPETDGLVPNQSFKKVIAKINLMASIQVQACDDLQQMIALCDYWATESHDLNAHEQRVKDEYLVVNMVRTAITNDINSLVKVFGAGKAVDHAHLQTLLEQLREKASSLSDALPKYLLAQSTVLACYHGLHVEFVHVDGVHRQFTSQQGKSRSLSLFIESPSHCCCW